MANYRNIILNHEKEFNRLHKELHESVKHRDKSQSHRETWVRAADRFRSYHSVVNDWVHDIEVSDICDWADARDFIFQYIKIDSIYHHSGYTKELFFKKIKSCELTEKECQTLREVIIKRIHAGAYRDFRKLCRLIPRIQNDAFDEEVSMLTKAKAKSVSTRANFAANYFSTV